VYVLIMSPMTPEADSGSGPGPSSRSERWILAGFLLVILGLFAVELLRDPAPVKLSVLFVLLWWIPLLFIHEGAHALMARILGWGVRRVVIGFGPVLKRWRREGLDVEIRRIPVSGFVQSYPRDTRFPRTKDALIYAAGPGSELLVALAVAGALGWDALLTVNDSIPRLAAQSLAAAAAIQAVINLIPGMVSDPRDAVGRRFSPTDGMGLLTAWFQDPRDYQRQVAYWRQVEAGTLPEEEREP